MRFRSARRVGPEHIGRRVTLRRRLPDGTASDVIGVLRAASDDEFVVKTKTGEDVSVPVRDVIASRAIEKQR